MTPDINVRVSPPTLVCPSCGSSNAFGATACTACGASLGTLANNAETVEVPSLEQDPQTLELWQQLRDATIGEYDIYAPIGRGGMATVFLALDLALEREVAIKVISPDMWQTKSFVERFKREARTAANLSHPNIIPVHLVKDANGLVFFVMKYVNGRSLDSIIREEGAVDFDLAISVLSQVGNALHFAHRKGVVHRDVKPANVMIDQDGWVLVTDFGIAKVADSGALTSAGMIVGTPAYMSPEQFSGLAISGAADQYSLGIVAYEMLTGKKPFAASSVVEMMRAHLIDNAAAPRVLRPDMPPALSDVIMRMIEKDPAQRWPSIGDALAALEPLSRAREEGARAVLISLAKSGSQARPRISVPVSPVLTRNPSAARQPQKVAEVARTPRRNVMLVAAACLTLAGAIDVAYRLQSASKTTAPASQTVRESGATPQTQPAPTPPMPVPKRADSSSANVARGRAKEPSKGMTQRAGASEVKKTESAVPPAQRLGAPIDSQRTSAPVTNPLTLTAPPVTPPATPPTTVDSVAARPAAPSVPAYGYVRIGSRIPNAVLYIDGKAQGFLQALRNVKLSLGTVQIGVHADGCKSWDSTVTVVPIASSKDTVRLNYKNPVCPP